MKMRHVQRAAAALTLIVLGVSSGEAQELSANGGALLVAGKQVSLPGDMWKIVWSVGSGEGEERVRTVALARSKGDQLLGLAIVRTNEVKRKAIFPATANCERLDVYFADLRYDNAREGYCEWANLVRVRWEESKTAPESLDLMRALSSALDAGGVKKPSRFLQLAARARTVGHMIDARFYFPADVSRPAGEPAKGFFAKIASHPVRAPIPPDAADAVAKLTRSAPLLQARLEDSVRLVQGSGAPMPDLFSGSGSGQLLEERMERFSKAVDSSKLDASYADQARWDAAKQISPEDDPSWSLWKRSLAKVATYRAASTLDSISVSWLITGSAAQGFGFAGIDAVLAPGLAYVNEIYWAASGIGAPAAPLTPREFPEFGDDVSPDR